MKNTKKNLSLAIALAMTLFTSIRIFAMFGASNQPQQQPQTSSFGQPTPTQAQTEQLRTFGFTQPSPPKTATPSFGSISNQPSAGISFGKTPQPQATTPFGSTPIQQQKAPQISNNPLLLAYFTPQDQVKITNTLFHLLDNAKKQIYIAIYWITDSAIIEKIIAAKHRNVDVQIVIDESSLGYLDVTTQFLQHGIVPIISPSKNRNAAGLMHNKFVVIDEATVFTGSANFTQRAFNPNSEYFNFENALVIDSIDIAKQFSNAFMSMQKELFDFYVDIIAFNNRNDLPNWVNSLMPSIYQQQDLMRRSVKQLINNYSSIEQSRINNFFGIQSTIRQDHVTEKQERLLKTKGFSSQEILKLSKQEASQLIGVILSDYSWERATEKQRSLLKNKGFPDQDILFLSKDKASDLISQVLGRGMQQPYRW